METINDLISDEKWQILFSSLIAILLSIPFAKYLSDRQKAIKNNRNKRYKEIVQLCSKVISDGNIRNIFDLAEFVEGYEHFTDLRIIFPRSYYSLISSIKHVILISSEEKNDSIAKIDLLKKELRKLEKEIELKEPFANIPTKERSLMTDIMEISQQKNNKIFVDKLHKLSDLILTREDTIKRIGADNEKALKLTRRSIYLTILFFIISAALTIFTIL